MTQNQNPTLDFAAACDIVKDIAENGRIKPGTDRSVVVAAYRIVRMKAKGLGYWPSYVEKVIDLLTEEARAKAEARAAEAEENAKLRLARLEEARETRYQANLRHKQNKLEKAERNRAEAKQLGCGTKKH